jgi:hypothetical protein
MSTKYWIRQLRSSPHLIDRLRALRHLQECQDQPGVHTALCLTAVDTPQAPLRSALMAVLKDNPRAEAYFLGVARGEGPAHIRKWALLNLSTLGCRRAREVVLKSLEDSDSGVCQAAASHVSLYTDEEARQAFIHYFQTQRAVYLKDVGNRLGRRFARWLQKIRPIRLAPDAGTLDKVRQADG